MFDSARIRSDMTKKCTGCRKHRNLSMVAASGAAVDEALSAVGEDVVVHPDAVPLIGTVRAPGGRGAAVFQ